VTRHSFDVFFRQRFSRTVVLLIAMGASRADAEDATQEAMTLAWRQWDSIHEPAAWVRTVAVRAFWRQLRTRQLTVPLDEAIYEPVADDDLAIFADEEQRVLRLFRALPPGQRAVAALIYDGMSCEEIADLIGKPSGTIRSNLRHARKTLRGTMLMAWL
jgi:RNA polymerase sigma factor (sigma-70 family)